MGQACRLSAASARGLVAAVVKDEGRLVHAHPAQPLAVGLPRRACQVDLAVVLLLLLGWLLRLLRGGGRCAMHRRCRC